MHTITATHHVPHRSRKVLNPLEWITAAVATHRQRLLLNELDDHMLDDIGIDPATARKEAKRPFWDLPH